MVKPKLWFHLVRHNCVSNAWSLTRLTLMANGCWACAVSIRRAAIGFRLDTSLMANRRLLSLSLASAASVALRPLTSSEPTSFEDRGRGRTSHEHGVPVHGDHAGGDSTHKGTFAPSLLLPVSVSPQRTLPRP